MILDQLAGVRPRVISNVFIEPMLVEDAVRPYVERAATHQGPTQFVCLYGAVGSGKSWALKQLARCFSDAAHVWFADDPDPNALQECWAFPLAIYARTQPVDFKHTAVFQLSPWTDDDLIEYLLARHPEMCKSVMQRVLASHDRRELRGNPETWSRVLDAFAGDVSLTSIREAVLQQVQLDSLPTDVRGLIEQLCLAASIESRMGQASVLYFKLHERDTPQSLPRPLHLPWVRRIVGAKCLADRIRNDCLEGNDLEFELPAELIDETAANLASDRDAIRILEGIVSSSTWREHANAASLLHAMKIGWQPKPWKRWLRFLSKDLPGKFWLPCLAHARLARADWPKAYLRQLNMEGVNLQAANLADARFDRSSLRDADLRGANLVRASFRRCNVTRACLAEADLSDARGAESTFETADLSQANLTRGHFERTDFDAADLTCANCEWAVFTKARFHRTKLEGTNLSNAICDSVDFVEVDLRETVLLGASFHAAGLKGCNLEDVEWPDAELPEANLTGSLFTGSVMPRANFRGAILRDTGLAEIQWEDADLRRADLRGATFHMGSSRSGLVGSPRPMEGSKTGFYVDDLAEQDFKLPEEIRKANLRGANLRGANIEGVDFYLVDLRDALLDEDQRRYVAERGAIIDEND